MAEYDDDDLDNDNAFGKYACMHRRWYIFFVCLGFFLYGLMNLSYFLFYSYVRLFEMRPSRHCVGPRCDQMLTCPSTQESSYELRLCVMTIGALVFGATGLMATLQRYANEMYSFAGWLIASCVLFATIALLDGAYMFICGGHYSSNMIQETLLWPIHNWPVNEGIKYELRQIKEYPAEYVNNIVHHNVAQFYLAWVGIRIIFFAAFAQQSYVLAQRFHYGLAGMGINFSIGNWSKRLLLKKEMNEVAHNTFDMAYATGMDLGWTEDEFLLQRPMRQQARWYGGSMMHTGMAQAYDGFSDDRRNVLL